jgi:hypothetical protein
MAYYVSFQGQRYKLSTRTFVEAERRYGDGVWDRRGIEPSAFLVWHELRLRRPDLVPEEFDRFLDTVDLEELSGMLVEEPEQGKGDEPASAA